MNVPYLFDKRIFRPANITLHIEKLVLRVGKILKPKTIFLQKRPAVQLSRDIRGFPRRKSPGSEIPPNPGDRPRRSDGSPEENGLSTVWHNCSRRYPRIFFRQCSGIFEAPKGPEDNHHMKSRYSPSAAYCPLFLALLNALRPRDPRRLILESLLQVSLRRPLPSGPRTCSPQE